MLEVYLLGTGGTVPLPTRWLTSCLVKFQGKQILIDCGEGTQIALHKQGISVKHIDAIMLTHFHADHTAGLPGLLLSMAKADRTEPITVYGPKGLKEILQGVYLIARYIPFDIQYVEYQEKEMKFEVCGLNVTAFAVKHSVPCYSYVFDVERNARFDPDKARKNGVPLKYWGKLQKGQKIEAEEGIFTPDMVLAEQRKGLRLAYSTDTRPTQYILDHVKNADLFIGEGMYGDPEKIEKAKLNQHSLMSETASIAARANVKRLWLTHYSPSMMNPQDYKDDVCAIFANTTISKDGQHIDLSFED